jgi:HAD superfamily 5'-nucleotidase-like hydrolase
MTRHLARARGACFSSGGASLGGHTRDGSSFAAIAGTPQRRTRHVTHVSSLSDPLPEDIPSWTGQALDADETTTLPFEAKSRDEDGEVRLDSKTEKRSPSLETASRTYAVPTSSRIFCNRSLNMANIAAVGFDMDYTLAMYKPETFETLAYAETKKKLVDVYGYPRSVLELEYDHTYMVRGLVVDKKRGNVLKMDRHKYVKVARHGFEPLSTESRIETYCATSAKADQFSGPGYANVDTLFALGETYLFCQLVQLKERYLREEETEEEEEENENEDESEPNEEDDALRRRRALACKPFEKMYDEIRASVDLCHRDGTLKRAVAEDPGKYIHADDALVPMLRALRASGKKVFLLTNSLWDFTNVVMNFLVADQRGEAKTVEWMNLFDAVITGSCKPGFFENERAAILEVDVNTSDLRNTDDGAPMTPIGASEAEDAPFAGLASFSSGDKRDKKQPPRAYQGGSYRHLHAMLGVSGGNQILYVGDHIYGDVMRSKKTLGWRTMLVVPELAHELKCLEDAEAKGAPEAIRNLRRERDALSDAAQLRRWRASVIRDASVEAGTGWSGGTSFGDDPSGVDGYEGARDLGDAHFFAADPELRELTLRAAEAKKRHREKTRELHFLFHPVWGQLMKAGSQNSRFAHQLERYACLYTSHARNLVAYSPQKTYRGQSDFMPHDDRGDGEHH